MGLRPRLGRSSPILALALATASPTCAQISLADAMASALAASPELRALSYDVAIEQENALQALENSRPAVDMTLAARRAGGSARSTGSARADVPLYKPESNATERAGNARIEAEVGRLEAASQATLLAVVEVFNDISRDEEEVRLRRSAEDRLLEQLEESRALFSIGSATRTDVAQSEGRPSLARSETLRVIARLRANQRKFERLLGHPSDELVASTPPSVPPSADAAAEQAILTSPKIREAKARVLAALEDVRAAKAGRLPTVTASYEAGSGTPEERRLIERGVRRTDGWWASAGIKAEASVYAGGRFGSKVRETEALHDQRVAELELARRRSVEAVRIAYAELETARARVSASEIAVRANRLARDGTRLEHTVGSRSIIDILNAEEALVSAEVDLVSARRDEQVASYRVLAEAGLLVRCSERDCRLIDPVGPR